MLLPSSIHRAEDFVGIAMPMVGLVCANALPPSAMVARLASASADNVVFLSMLLLPLILVAGATCTTRRRSQFFGRGLQYGIWVSHLLSACELHVRLRPALCRNFHHKSAPVFGIGHARRFVHALPGRGDEKTREIRPDK